MLGSCHYVWSSLILVVLHPALTEELPVQNKMFTQNEQTHHAKRYFNISRVSFSLSSHSNLYNFYLFTFVCVLVYTPECVTVCVCTVCVCTYSYGMALKTRWSSSVSCSAISKAEWLSNGSVLESSMAWPQQQAEKSITTTKAKKKKGFILKRLFLWSFLTICVISSRVTWLSPGSSWVRVLHQRRHNCYMIFDRCFFSKQFYNIDIKTPLKELLISRFYSFLVWLHNILHKYFIGTGVLDSSCFVMLHPFKSLVCVSQRNR